MELPKLPESCGHVHSDGAFCWDRSPGAGLWPVELFTADQMWEYVLADRASRASRVGAQTPATLAKAMGTKVQPILLALMRAGQSATMNQPLDNAQIAYLILNGVDRASGSLPVGAEGVTTPPASQWEAMATAPRDGTPVLLCPRLSNDACNLKYPFVGRDWGDGTGWSFAAPVGYGGIPDEWLRGWRSLVASSPVAACPLTEEQIDSIVEELFPPINGHHEEWLRGVARPIARAVEAAHGIGAPAGNPEGEVSNG